MGVAVHEQTCDGKHPHEFRMPCGQLRHEVTKVDPLKGDSNGLAFEARRGTGCRPEPDSDGRHNIGGGGCGRHTGFSLLPGGQDVSIGSQTGCAPILSRVASLLLLTNALAPSTEVLPALGLLSHHVRVLPAEPAALVNAPVGDAVLVDARRDLAQVKALCRVLRASGMSTPLIAVLTEGGLAALSADWGVDDVILDTAGPAEIDARLRLALSRIALADDVESEPIRWGDLTIDEDSYAARVRGRALDLTYKEFELLKFLAQHPGRVFSRAQLLQEVWGYDYFGGTRTVDVHVRRLRAKLGPEHDQLIGTVRHVGYRFVPERPRDVDEGAAAASATAS